ncbi:ketoacyl-ACP synthase III [uncultured Cloacibacillus sp.]|uniref:ketoacyl-ACP synthase III n=1 Tax=uncultured Cloacibacillus sp. TaxID=889794 RepID=UPI0025E3DE1A|nr:ketoacyl-ACP synthase III [uncultured Cloacibacillus sp.]
MPDFALARANNIKIAGLAACVPSHIVYNKEAAYELYGDDIDGVIKTTGVVERRTSPEGKITSLDLCIRAAEYLRDECDVSYNDFGGVICVTQTPDCLLPNNSTYAQQRLGLPLSVSAFDINLACSGYIYGLWAAALTAQSLSKPVLLLDGDTHSHFVSTKDRATAVLFGDAGTATIIEPSEENTEWTFAFETDGSKRDALIIPEGGYRNRANEHSVEYREYPDGGTRRGIDMKMDGMEVFNFVVRSVPKCLDFLMHETKTAPEDYDILALHQANLFMIRQVAKKMKFPMDKVPTTIHKFGNSSSATIPVTLASELHERIQAERLKVLASGFGAGLSLASVSMGLGPCCCPGVVEYDC